MRGGTPDADAEAGWGEEHTIAQPSVAYMLLIETGATSGTALRFNKGAPMDPTAIGRAGAFHINGHGVLDIHAFAHFDGRSVFICSTDISNPVWVDDRPVGRAWSELSPNCRLRFGEVTASFLYAPAEAGAPPSSGDVSQDATRLDYQVPEDLAAMSTGGLTPLPGDATVVAPPPDLVYEEHPPFASPTGSPRPAAGTPAVDRPQAPVPSNNLPPFSTAPSVAPAVAPQLVVVAPQTNPAPPQATPAQDGSTAPSIARSKLLASIWQRKLVVMFFLASFALTLVTLMVLFRVRTPPRPTPQQEQPQQAPVAPTDTPQAPSSAGIIVYPEPPAPPAASASSSAANRPRGKSKGPPPVTEERAAADAVHGGDLALALKLYDKLAAERPENPAFGRAAQLLRERPPHAP